MRAVVLRRPRTLELADVPVPRLTAANHVLVRVEACGICGSDLRYWNGENPWALHTLGHHVDSPPNIILGHEYAGVVTAVNAPAYEHWLGQRVGVQAYRTCGACDFCRSGRENLCRATIHMGHGQGWGPMDYYPGAYAEYCLAWGDLLYALPDDVSFAEAAMADVLCVAVHVAGRAHPCPGATVVIGGGPVGLFVAQVAHARGVEDIYVLEPSPVACAVLAHYPYIRNTAPPPGSAALVCDTVGTSETLSAGLEMLAPSGALVNVAVHDAKLAWNALALGSEKSVTSSSNAHYRDVAEAYDLINSHRVDVAPMLTHRLPLEDYAQAFELLLSTPKQAYKVVLEPQRRH